MIYIYFSPFGAGGLGKLTVLNNHNEMLKPNQCANIALLAAWTKKISNAKTGFALLANGPVAATVNVFANNNPVVACNPTSVAPSPTKFTVNPVVKAFTTSALGGTKSKSFTDAFNRSPNLTKPNDQNVVKKPAIIPNKIKYNPASVAFVNPLNKNENTTTTAATVNKINCAQNPHLPRVLQAFAVLVTFLAMLSALSTEAFGRNRFGGFPSRAVFDRLYCL